MTETQTIGRVKGYGLDAPSRDSAINALTRFMEKGEAEELWDSACTTHNVLSNTSNLDELQKAFEALSSKPGTVGVVGKSLLVRVNSYKLLNRKQNG